MRKYEFKAELSGEDADIIEGIINMTTEDIREMYFYYSDNKIVWAKSNGSYILYSNEDVFNTDKKDATHFVVFLK